MLEQEGGGAWGFGIGAATLNFGKGNRNSKFWKGGPEPNISERRAETQNFGKEGRNPKFWKEPIIFERKTGTKILGKGRRNSIFRKGGSEPKI